jgi:hypothetical protein
MNITIASTLLKEREPFLKAKNAASAAHDKTVAAAQKALDKAKAQHLSEVAASQKDYEAKVSATTTTIAKSEQSLIAARDKLNSFDDEVDAFQKGQSVSSKRASQAGSSEKSSGRRCTICQKVGHNKAGHAKFLKREAQEARAAAKGAPSSPGKTAPKAKGKAAQKGKSEVASGVRPPIPSAIRLILGRRTMNVGEILAELVRLRWMPRSNKPRNYISFILSSNAKEGKKNGPPPIFEAVKGKGRGHYCVRDGLPPLAADIREKFGSKVGASASNGAGKVEAQKVAAAPKPAKATKAAKGPKVCGCSTCGQPGHNARGHDNFVKREEAKAQGVKAPKPVKETKTKAPKAVKAPKAAVGRGNGPRTCSICQKAGHNKAGHAKFEKNEAQAAAPSPAPKKAAPVKTGKGGQKCGKCGQLGHNARGHDAFLGQPQAGAVAPKAPEAKSTQTQNPPDPEPAVPPPPVVLRTSEQVLASEDAAEAARKNGKDPLAGLEDTVHAAFGSGSAHA